MSRINYPVTFEDQQTLFVAVMAKHKSLGAKSPLLLLAKKQNLNLAALEESIAPAAAQNTASGSLRRDSEEDTQQRDALLEVPWANLLGEVQFLKHLFAGAERELGEWGVPVDAQARIAYPKGAVAEATLIQTFLNYHLSLKDESPLLFYLDEHPQINVQDDLKAAGDVILKNTERNVTTGDSELATQQRDKVWAPVEKAIHLIGAFLMGLYHEDSRKMAAWGFKVVEDAAGEREQVSTIDPATQKNLTSIKIPSVMTNVGEDVLQVIQGKGEKSKTFPLKSGEKLGMVRGFSKVTVVNPSTLVVGKVKVTVSK